MLVDVDFQASQYGSEAARILALDGGGSRPMALAGGYGKSAAVLPELKKWRAADLFPDAHSPAGALAGLYLYFSLVDDAHNIAQDLDTPDGSFWHGIVHRREPDAGNAAYWFRKVGRHPIFPTLRDEARRLRFDTGSDWNPFEFIDFCEAARIRPGSHEEDIAVHVQLAEWQLLFDYCARPKGQEKKN
ncbi:MAG: hypothetical protein ABJC09_03730 [Terriglobia bacterium]